MSIDWPRTPRKRDEVAVFVLLGIAAAWSVFRLARSFGILFGLSDDLYTYYALWTLLQYRDMADIALRQSLYLPHTWLFVTPLFMFGWAVGRFLMLLVNVGAVLYICWRLAELTGLRGGRKWLLLAFFCSWLGTGLILGLGNLGLVCLAAMLAGFPFDSAGKQGFLALSAMKQSLVFPVYLKLLVTRPKVLLLPFAVFGICGVAALLWARLNIAEALHMARGAMASVGTWTQYDHLCLRRLLAAVVHSPGVVSVLNWVVWFALFGAVMRMRDSLVQFAAMLLLSLLPLYHNVYDIVAAVPALAIFLKRCGLTWPTLMTVLLVTNVVSPLVRFAPAPIRPMLNTLEFAYYPLIILLFLAGLFWVDTRGRKTGSTVPAGITELAKA